jgi:XTP/dITP diphosphohydrolase
MALLFATSNPHKIDEVRAILAAVDIEVTGLDSLPQQPAEPVEDADSFAGNARLKAVGYARATGIRCLAEDSGLAVDAIGGSPGVHSARYAGVDGTRPQRDRANNARLLAELRAIGGEGHTARFVCAMCVADPDGSIIAESRGTYEGVITFEPRGENGFGYDPLLYLPDVGCTSAELTPAAKNARSHRGAAARIMAKLLLTERPTRET